MSKKELDPRVIAKHNKEQKECLSQMWEVLGLLQPNQLFFVALKAGERADYLQKVTDGIVQPRGELPPVALPLKEEFSLLDMPITGARARALSAVLDNLVKLDLEHLYRFTTQITVCAVKEHLKNLRVD